MKQEDFDFIVKLLKEKSGIVITPDKTYLLESRLMPLARKTNFAAIDDLVMALRGRNEQLTKQVIDSMTTNESFFFRDLKPFDQFRDMVLPYLIKTRAGQKSFRIWSAACSSGQEAYSLCMILKEKEAELKDWKIEIVGTDLSSEILAKAKEGLYTQFEVQRGLPIQYLVKYFQKKGDMWQISDEFRKMVQYREWNLMDDFKPLGSFDVVFCRNVLIYFDQADKTKILGKIADISSKDSLLYLGGAETVLGVTERFKSIPGKRGIYIASSADANVISQLVGDSAAQPSTSPAPIPPQPAASTTPKPTIAPAAMPPKPAAPATAAFAPRPAAPAPTTPSTATAPKPATPAGGTAFAPRPAAPAPTTPSTATAPKPATPAATTFAPRPATPTPATTPAATPRPTVPTSTTFAPRPAAPVKKD